MIDILACPVCNGREFRPIATCKDYTVSHETFTIKQCSHCGLGITSPRPEDAQLGLYYQSAEYISHSGNSSGIIGTLYKSARSFSIEWKKSIITSFLQKGSILDFGCGTGEFLNSFQKASWEVTGIEPSELARKKAKILNGENVFESLIEIEEKKFDVITAWHVIEHVPNLIETIQTLKSHLKKGGTIFIAVPNYESPDASQYKNQWAAFDVPRHLWHFSKKTMQILLETEGLEVIRVLPMKLDAYYVSLLSENYKNKNQHSFIRLIKGLLSGLQSNWKARKKINHSSLIYIAKIHEA